MSMSVIVMLYMESSTDNLFSEHVQQTVVLLIYDLGR